MFKKILVPVDISAPEPAKPAIKAAAELAKAIDAEIRLVYVSPFLLDAALPYLPDNFFQKEEEESKKRLEALAFEAGLTADRTSVASMCGAVHHLVLEEAKKFGADVIVIGSRQPTVSTYFLGSNASAILRHATCSVLVIRGGASTS